MQTVFIAGADHGIGRALAHACLDRGCTVYAAAGQEDRTLLPRPGYYCLPIDFHSPETLRDEIKTFTQRHTFDRVILCSEAVGEISDLTDLTLTELQQLLDVNLFALKQILDAILLHATVKQVVLVGVDTTRLMYRGWGAYVATREVMNTLLPFYTFEFPDTHFSTLVPDLTASPELTRIFKTANTRRFPSVARIQGSLIKSPEQTAEELLIGFERVRDFRSGERYKLEELLK
jgi:NAD(P)-dependent dehydrogenase (short-subunit alcohol dehydrogenase family)